MTHRTPRLARTLAGLLAALALPLASGDALAQNPGPSAERGRYLTLIGGCNDCHTAGFAPSGGRLPQAQWLMGDAVGFRGPWGTTYPANLRLTFSRMTEDEWVKVAKTVEYRPPMPWFALREMTEVDLRSIYRFVRTLQPLGNPAPAYLPPNQAPQGPVITWPAPPPGK